MSALGHQRTITDVGITSALLPKGDIDNLVQLICIGGRERQEADMIATPTWMLEGRTFAAATSAARTNTQFVAGSVRSPQDDGDGAGERCMMLAALTPQPHPRSRSL